MKCYVCEKEAENWSIRDGKPHCVECDRKIVALVLSFVMDWKGRKLVLSDLVATYKPQWESLKLDARGFEQLVIRRLLPYVL